jgi:hypothetical protein
MEQVFSKTIAANSGAGAGDQQVDLIAVLVLDPWNVVVLDFV